MDLLLRKKILVKLSFGTNLLSTPIVRVLGNIDNKFSNVSGLTGIVELGDWHLFVTNRKTSTIDRISFGDNLDNTPFVINLGDFTAVLNGQLVLQLPKAVNLLRLHLKLWDQWFCYFKMGCTVHR